MISWVVLDFHLRPETKTAKSIVFVGHKGIFFCYVSVQVSADLFLRPG